LAAYARPERGFFAFGPRRKLSLTSSSSRAYLARLATTQRRAVAALRRAIPQARVGWRYRILLDGFAVSLPYRRLPDLMRLPFVRRVYPSLRYSLDLNRSPTLIAAPALRALTGADGAGIKVAVVDDGIDPRHPFLDPAGLSYPPGFPKGVEGFTTPKVIVARAFFGPVSTSEARQPLDESRSFHGTHVAGVIAGVAGTDAPAGVRGTCQVAAGGCHPAVSGLSGVAPRAYLGNYRVFSVPNPLGGCCLANTPEIVAAFEAAVADGMDVINFSGGGPQTDPRSDALVEAVANVVRAGVVPVISAGNDRDLFGFGTVGSPSTAPDAISVAAVTNAHVFTRAMTVLSPELPGSIPVVPAARGLPASWAASDQRLVDVGALRGRDGQPVDRRLCAESGDPSGAGSPLVPGSLAGALALVWRGGCTFESKAARAAAAGAVGMIVVDNRPGDPTAIPLPLGLPTGTVSDLDGERLRQALAAAGGRALVRVSSDEQEVPTSWGGVPTSFSSAGPTPFGHELKPDISAPGAQIISSTLLEFAGDRYAVLDGTSFSAPHIAGAAALLLQRHPGWTPKQVKSALMSTAGPVFADTGKTSEAPVLVEGAGLARLTEADDPKLFTDPVSLSFRDLDVSAGAASRTLLVAVSDAGGGDGIWQVELQPQAASEGAAIEAPPAIAVPPGGTATLPVTVRAQAAAATGDNYGFLVLRRGQVARRLPYAFFVIRPALAGAQVRPLGPVQRGDTRQGEDRARAYRWPSSPFGIVGLFGVDEAGSEDGKEQVYVLDLPRRAVNVGVAVQDPPLDVRASVRALLNANAPIHPWFLGSLNESDVQGAAGTPVNVNSLMPDYLFNVGAAGTVFAPPGRYYVSVDSGRDPFSGRSLARPYVLRSWVDDVRPPRVRLLTRRVSAGRPTVVAHVTDGQSGVDPLSLLLEIKGRQIGALLFERETGMAVFSLPRDLPRLDAGPAFMRVIASDLQEAKNVNTEGESLMPNTAFEGVRADVVDGPTVTWLAPSRAACLPRRARLLVAAGSPATVSSVGFYDGSRQIGRVRKSLAGLYSLTWATAGAKRGRHLLSAVVSDTAGREARASLSVRVCR
jgi:subtilisin family serine protease